VIVTYAPSWIVITYPSGSETAKVRPNGPSDGSVVIDSPCAASWSCGELVVQRLGAVDLDPDRDSETGLPGVKIGVGE
jgi:hypothetical protein